MRSPSFSSSRSLTLLTGVLAAFWTAHPSAPLAAQDSFYEDPEQGFYFYKDDEPPSHPPAKEPPPAQPPSPHPPRTAADFPVEELWTMHPDRFREVWEATLAAALQDPSEDRVVAYKQIETIARHRATRFAIAASLVGLRHPELSTLRDAPSSNPGARAKHELRAVEISSTLSGARDEFALLYFTSPDCPFCAEQDPILDYFAVKHGWDVKRVDVRSEPRAAQVFGVSTTPTLLLAYRHSDEPMPVAVGVVALPTLERNVYRGVRWLRGDVSRENLWLYDHERGGGFDPDAVRQIGNRP